MADQSRSEHILALAKELLDDIELNRTNAESLILKASRLARWVGSEEIRYWLKLEMGGYNGSNEISLKYMGITGRWFNKEKKTGYWGPLAQQEAAIEAEKAKLAALRTPLTRSGTGSTSSPITLYCTAKSTIREGNETYEQQADRIAKQVMRTPNP